MFEAIRATLLVSGLVFPGIAAYTAVYLTLACMALSLPRVRPDTLDSRVLLGLAVGLATLFVSILLNGGAPGDWTVLLILLPFVGVLPVAAILDRVTPIQFGTLCLIGALAAAAVGAIDVFALEVRRAGGGNNPIHYASLATMLGFVSLIGAAHARSTARFFFVLGPAAAVAAVLLSESRGPLLAACVLMTIALVVFWRDRAMFMALLALPMAVAIALVASGEGQRAMLLFWDILSERTQESNDQRWLMYNAALKMFLQSPLWGHGYGSFMETARELLPIRERYDNLHSDIANLAAVGGVLGIVAYFGLVFSPLLALLSAAARSDRAIVFLSLALSGGNATLGLTNAILGILPQMTLLVLMLGYLVALEKRAEPAPPQ
ncbi:O-antigen ligase family protein [Pelagibacterium halotolerans]|uniref:Putative membrane protein n=1 Tax=Pelagibacterium halotolerans (strain DSM 22347 / JCM 15775 / CGMCC 1.7692 / B2) TaxID=1082931 RepID=G4RBQ2_PELHB|nr:O-antigen ligase family protein [Pelagibacterium halotolerans]AEQ53693.1 putative membrane protein [Pelagibacterium halotolerans B2]QJR20143.1 O-antigen ligase family protein [Pelagibacterium halotolerans]SEA78951.1 O-antigen ligase [Pelagibacterium halotolerans]